MSNIITSGIELRNHKGYQDYLRLLQEEKRRWIPLSGAMMVFPATFIAISYNMVSYFQSGFIDIKQAYEWLFIIILLSVSMSVATTINYDKKINEVKSLAEDSSSIVFIGAVEDLRTEYQGREIHYKALVRHHESTHEYRIPSKMYYLFERGEERVFTANKKGFLYGFRND